MTFVEKLRAWSEEEGAHPANLCKVIGEAADRIEELEAELEDINAEILDRAIAGSKHDMRGV